MNSLASLLTEHGVLLVFVSSFAARIGLPVPAAPILVVAGALGMTGGLAFWPVIIAAVVANMLGDGLWFVAGRRYGHRVMRLLCRVSLSPDTCVRQSEAFIARWGGSALIAAKFVPGVSTIAAPMAGALGMPVARFAAFDFAGALAWTAAYALLGAAFSHDIQAVLDTLADIGLMTGAALVALLGLYLFIRLLRRRRALRALAAPRMSADELRGMIEQGLSPTVIDVRSALSVRLDPRRIPGALAIEAKDIAAHARSLPPGLPVVLYCNCPNEVSAAQAARILARHGVTDCHLLTGGLDAWTETDAPPQHARQSAVAGLNAMKQAD